MIDSVRQSVQAIANKNNRGYITPSDFNLYAKLAQLDIFEDYFSDVNSFVNKKNARLFTVGQDRGMNSGFGDLQKSYEEEIDAFSVIATLIGSGSDFEYPADAYRIMSLVTAGIEIDKISYSEYIKMSNSNLSQASALFPVYYSNEGQAIIYPAPTGAVTVHYIREPLTPNWTYTTLSGGEPIFNPSAIDYQDFEISETDEPLLVAKICQYVGISIREADVYQFGQATEIKERQQ